MGPFQRDAQPAWGDRHHRQCAIAPGKFDRHPAAKGIAQHMHATQSVRIQVRLDRVGQAATDGRSAIIGEPP